MIEGIHEIVVRNVDDILDALSFAAFHQQKNDELQTYSKSAILKFRILNLAVSLRIRPGIKS